MVINKDPITSLKMFPKRLSVSEFIIRCGVREDIKYKSYFMRSGQFISDKTQENRVIQLMCLLNIFKYPEEPDMLWFFLGVKDRKVNNPTEVPAGLHTE